MPSANVPGHLCDPPAFFRRLTKPVGVPVENGELYNWGVVLPPVELDAVQAQPETRVACVRHRSAVAVG
eukprot:15440322-Alexandrium_andersonii.AAC.1